MPGVALDELTNVDTGHTCDATTSSAAHSPNVYTNNKKTHRVGDALDTHDYPVGDGCGSHSFVLADYGPNVFVNDKGIGRFLDSYTDSGHFVSKGSFNVYANGND
ncbi:MAG TPA: PaaR repeat-containing protein [Flavobacteriales bacterium]|nr:PaaR repeat-containing protein [Flavobacteriales bacterium]